MAFVELEPDRREFISELAEDVWRTYSGEKWVYLDGVVRDAGLGLSYGDFGAAFDGALEHRAGSFHVFCNLRENQKANQSRPRFTIGHELGHYFIDEHRNALAAGIPPHGSFTDQPTDNPVEVEANLFAANLLMPTQEFQSELRAARTGLLGILDLASTFGVSRQSTALRYVALCGRPCAIVMHRNGAKPWWDISPELRAQGFSKIRVAAEKLSPESASVLALRDKKATGNAPFCSNVLASEWFAGVTHGSSNDQFVRETAIRLGEFGVLTMLEM